MIEHMNAIDTLNDQIMALLDLMMMADGSVDIKSMNVASEMCMTMQVELKVEIDKIFDEWKGKIHEVPEKEIPKDAIITGHNNAVNTNIGNCPVCNTRELRACDFDYCPDCGQRLNW